MTPTTEELIQILEAVVAPEFEATYCDDVLGINWFDARDKAVKQLRAELSRREDRFVLVVDLPVAFAKLQRAGEVTLFFTESEYNALRDLLLASRGEKS